MQQKQDVLIAAVYSGLGNRMRVLLSAREAAKKKNLAFQYFWQIDHRFQARLSDLWELDSERIGLLRYFVAAKRFGTSQALPAIPQAGRRVTILRGQQPVVDEDGTKFGWKTALRDLLPVPGVQDRVRALWSEELKESAYIAVMVRAHPQSHQLTKDTSPPSWFIARMLQISAELPGVRFFLSCDHPETQEHIMGKVPNVVAQKKTSRYNSKDGVVDAVVDLYLAGLGAHLIGPHWSSFVDMAEGLHPHHRDAETPMRESASIKEIKSLLQRQDNVVETYPWLRLE